MTRSKNSTKLVELLMSLVLITSCFVGGTFARYITSTSSEDSARVAVWGINADEVEMDLFDAQYELDGTVVAKANDGDNIIAPGTGKMSKFSIVNLDDTLAPEVMYEVRINVDDTEIDQRILDNPSIQWKLDNNNWGTWESTKADIIALSGDPSGVKTYAPNTVATEFANGVEHTISWQWLLDNNNDTQDTAMGNEAVDEDITAKIVVKITAEQTDGSSTITNFSFIEGYSLDTDGSLLTNTNYMVTDFIPCEANYTYTVTENQAHTLSTNGSTMVRAVLYDENKNAIEVAYTDVRYTTGSFAHTINTTNDSAYIRIHFRKTDTDINITKQQKNNTNLIYTTGSFGMIQGIAISENYIFAGYSTQSGAQITNYVLRKIDKKTGEILQTSTNTFGHTDSITYNPNTNELIISSPVSQSYSYYIVDANTLEIKRSIDLTETLSSVCDGGVNFISYNENNNKYYLLSRNNNSTGRYSYVLNENFEYESRIYLGLNDSTGGSLSDMYVDDKYIYIPVNYDNEYQTYGTNDIFIYDINTGIKVEKKSINGPEHIEAIEFSDEKVYVSFVDKLYTTGNYQGKIYSINNISNIN